MVDWDLLVQNYRRRNSWIIQTFLIKTIACYSWDEFHLQHSYCFDLSRDWKNLHLLNESLFLVERLWLVLDVFHFGLFALFWFSRRDDQILFALAPCTAFIVLCLDIKYCLWLIGSDLFIHALFFLIDLFFLQTTLSFQELFIYMGKHLLRSLLPF